MQITIPSPINETVDAQISATAQMVKILQTLKREAEHEIVFAHPPTAYLLFLPLFSILTAQMILDGYMINSQQTSTVPFRVLPSSLLETAFDELVPRIDKALTKRPDIWTMSLYMVGELVDNISDHAHSRLNAVGFQSKDQTVELLVADTGISIPHAYRMADIQVRDDVDAVEKSLQGISSKTVEERGTGLPSIVRMVQALSGEMILLSAGALLQITKKNIQPLPVPFFWQGTCIYVRFPLPQKNMDLYAFLS
jgi:anti-sigma regulatory factor (Ser/Thr protein kinase)